MERNHTIMKKVLLFTLLITGSLAGRSQCGLNLADSVFNNSVTLIQATSARVNGDASNGDVGGALVLLRYVRTGFTDTVTSSTAAPNALRNLTGLVAGTQYTYYYSIYCGGGEIRQLGRYTFTTATQTVVYVDMRATAMDYTRIDTVLQFTPGDTLLGRGQNLPSLRYKSSDNTMYLYHPSCACWRPLAIDSSGIIALLDGKVDSVTVSGDSLFYWKVGVSYGYLLPALANQWLKVGNAGTDPALNFLGTTDAEDLVLKTNDIERFRITAAGDFFLSDDRTWDFNTHNLILKTNNGYLIIQSDDVGNVVHGYRKDTDPANRMQIQADGHIEWGDGTSGADIGITRVAAGTVSVLGTPTSTIHMSAADTAQIIFGPSDVPGNVGFNKAGFYFDGANNIIGINTSAGLLKIDTLNSFANANDSMMVWRPSTGRVGMRSIPSPSSSGITVNSTTITSGTDTRVPFNDAGVYGEDAGLTFIKATDVLNVGAKVAIGGGTAFVGLNLTGSTADIWVTDAGHDVGDLFGEGLGAGQYVTTRWDRATNTKVHNTEAHDVDQRWVTTGSTNTLFIDAGTDKVGILTSSPNSSLQVAGSFATAYVAATTTYPITASDYTIECTSGTFTATLPTAVGITGRMYFITNSGAGTITVATTSSQTFVNVVTTPTTLPLATLTGVVVQSNGANWLKVSSF